MVEKLADKNLEQEETIQKLNDNITDLVISVCLYVNVRTCTINGHACSSTETWHLSKDWCSCSILLTCTVLAQVYVLKEFMV